MFLEKISVTLYILNWGNKYTVDKGIIFLNVGEKSDKYREKNENKFCNTEIKLEQFYEFIIFNVNRNIFKI